MEPLTTCLVAMLCVLLYTSTRWPTNFPPGYRRIPLLGAIPWILTGLWDPWSTFWNSDQDGTGTNKARLSKSKNIFGFFVGSNPVVAIENFSLAKELFNKEEWSGRKNNFVTRYLRSDNGKTNKGLIFADGENWAEQRTFTIKNMKTFGFNTPGQESVIQEEAEELVNILSKQAGQDFLMHTEFAIPITNILWSMVVNKRFNTDDSKDLFNNTVGRINRIFKPTGLASMFVEYAFPVYALLLWVTGVSERKKALGEIRTMIREHAEEHRDSLDPNNPRDFMDVYINEIHSKKNPRFDQESMELTCFDLLKTGAETSATALLWCVLHLTWNQKVQQLAREEVDRVCGEERPGLHHDLPYCQAVIHEVQRMNATVVMGPPRRVTKDQKVDGYNVPCGSLAIANFWKFMNDPDHWDQPRKFRPERFLEKTDAGGWKLVKHERFVPYGFGRRMCMGQTMAKNTLFIVFATLLKHLKFDAPTAHPLPSPTNCTYGFISMPMPFYVNIKVIPKERPRP